MYNLLVCSSQAWSNLQQPLDVTGGEKQGETVSTHHPGFGRLVFMLACRKRNIVWCCAKQVHEATRCRKRYSSLVVSWGPYQFSQIRGIARNFGQIHTLHPRRWHWLAIVASLSKSLLLGLLGNSTFLRQENSCRKNYDDDDDYDIENGAVAALFSDPCETGLPPWGPPVTCV